MDPMLPFPCTVCAAWPCVCRKVRTPLQEWRNERKAMQVKALAGTLLWPDSRAPSAPEDSLSPLEPAFTGSYQRLYLAIRDAGVVENLANVLVDVARRARIDVSGFYVTSGARTAAQQTRLIDEGKTSTSPAMSRHVPCGMAAEAVDLAGRPDLISKLGAATFGTGVKWGGHWADPEPWHFYVELTERPCRAL